MTPTNDNNANENLIHCHFLQQTRLLIYFFLVFEYVLTAGPPILDRSSQIILLKNNYGLKINNLQSNILLNVKGDNKSWIVEHPRWILRTKKD